MDIHIYRNGEFIRTEKNVTSSMYTSIMIQQLFLWGQVEIKTERSLPPTRWPEGAEL